MDIKAMAKSKRSHTRHHQPRKHPHPSKTPAPSSSTSASADSVDPKLAKKEGRERKRAVQPPSLPSNWDRYEDEGSDDGQQVAELSIDSGSGELSRLTDSKAKAVPGEVKPKSKGANFSELIAQAKESRSSYPPSFHDTLPDFYQGLGPMLSIRGESILSWEGGDDFLADEEATTTQEAPFLRLDLQDLAEQLAKVDLAKRLFIEPDLLPPELHAQEANESDHEMLSEKSEKRKKARVPETFDELLSLYLDEEQNAEQERDEDEEDAKSLTAAISTCSPGTACAANLTDSKLDDIVFQDARETSSVTLVPEKDSKPFSAFESAAAEAELDMLLNSFSETKLFDPSATDSKVTTYKNQHETPLPSRENPSLDIPITSSLDDAFDNLLEETSKQDHKGSLSQSTEIKATCFELPSSTSSLHPSSKSKVLEDFDSWFDSIL